MTELFTHRHQQGEFVLPDDHSHAQGKLFQAVHTLLRFRPHEVATVKEEETEPQQLDLYPKAEHQLF